jgi:hypothetical protein
MFNRVLLQGSANMGNAESDLGEQQAHEVIEDIPGLGGLYDGVRAAVYAGKGDIAEATESALNIPGNLVEGVATVLDGPAGIASATADVVEDAIILA